MSARPDGTAFLLPSDIYYTQDTIRNTFSDGKTLDQTLNNLLGKGMEKREIVMINVVYKDGKWWSMDNRRLWVFKQLYKNRKCRKIKVKVVTVTDWKWKKRFTTKNGGTDIRIRGGAAPAIDSDSDGESEFFDSSDY